MELQSAMESINLLTSSHWMQWIYEQKINISNRIFKRKFYKLLRYVELKNF